MKVAEINEACKTKVFKSILNDILYSFRQSMVNLTGNYIDIKLTKIRTTPIMYSEGSSKVEGRIKNLVGGKISCVIDKKFSDFLLANVYVFDCENTIEYFIEDVFDIFSNVAKGGMLEIGLNESSNGDWNNNTYFIQYDMKLNVDNHIIYSKLIVGLDEMTSLYFKD